MKGFYILNFVFSQTSRPSVWEALFPIIIIFAIFYFLLILPQQRKIKSHRKFLQGLQKGDMVVTSSGIIGKVAGIAEKIIVLEVEGGMKLKILKEQIAGPYVETQKKDK